MANRPVLEFLLQAHATPADPAPVVVVRERRVCAEAPRQEGTVMARATNMGGAGSDFKRHDLKRG